MSRAHATPTLATPPARLPALVEALQRANAEQRAVVQSPLEGYQAVLAGAGTGKTSTLTLRIAHLLESGIAADKLLALTFTRKAADEMRERLVSLVGRKAHKLAIHTFHGWGLRLIQRYGETIGIQGRWQCLDDEDVEAIVRRQLKRQKDWDPKVLKAADVVQNLLEFKLRLYRKGMEAGNSIDVLDGGTYQPWIEARAEDAFLGEIHRGYEQEKRESSRLDFLDLLLLPRRIFLEEPEALADFRERTSHLLVDEFQDTDTDQYALVSLLHQNGQGTRVLVVGDDDQSLYGWRGALPGIFRRFVSETGATLYRLEENYRCQPWILDCANAVIGNNTDRFEKALRPNRGTPGPLTVERYNNAREEAQRLVEAVSRYLHKGVAPQDIAILYRINRFSAEVERSLLQRGIPYRVYGGTDFFKREEIRNALAYLRLALNPDDDVAFRRIVDVPRRRIGPKTLVEHAEYAQDWGWSLGRAAQNSAHPAVQAFGSMLAKLPALARLPVPQAIAEILKETGLPAWYRDQQKDREKGEKQAERLELLQERATIWCQDHPDGGNLADFLLESALESDSMAKDGEAVRLMTIHQAKGLEFPVVFVVGLEDGEFPSARSDLEEERRLFYVALTRGKDKVHLSYARQRLNAYHETQIQRPSPFLSELPQDRLQQKSVQALPVPALL